jgi:hypothetical protein
MKESDNLQSKLEDNHNSLLDFDGNIWMIGNSVASITDVA